MLAVNGMNGSGFEAIMSSFTKTLGVRDALVSAQLRMDSLKQSPIVGLAAYENYLGKFSPAERAAMLLDLQALMPDGVWPVFSIDPAPLRELNGGLIQSDAAARFGGSLGAVLPEELSKILIVLTDPKILWARRLALMMKTRPLAAKYGEDRSYKFLIQVQLRGWEAAPGRLKEELDGFTGYVDNCLRIFGDKVVFINGDSETLTFNNGIQDVTVTNRNIWPHPMQGKIPEAHLYLGCSGSDFDPVREAWARLSDLAKTRIPSPMRVDTTEIPNMWFCARTRKFQNVATCMRCVTSQGEHVIADAKPGWDKEPCAYEVAYGPEPHKTIEQSINEHNWGVLP